MGPIRRDPYGALPILNGWELTSDGFRRIYPYIPSGNLLQFANLNMAIEIVSFPIKKMVIFHSYVNVYQRVLAMIGL